MTMPDCSCPCSSHLIHLRAEFEEMQRRFERLERDVARESTDRQADVRLLRHNADEMAAAVAGRRS